MAPVLRGIESRLCPTERHLQGNTGSIQLPTYQLQFPVRRDSAYCQPPHDARTPLAQALPWIPVLRVPASSSSPSSSCKTAKRFRQQDPADSVQIPYPHDMSESQIQHRPETSDFHPDCDLERDSICSWVGEHRQESRGLAALHGLTFRRLREWLLLLWLPLR